MIGGIPPSDTLCKLNMFLDLEWQSGSTPGPTLGCGTPLSHGWPVPNVSSERSMKFLNECKNQNLHEKFVILLISKQLY